MLYVTGVPALNLPCKLKTFGDWHRFSVNWDNLKLYESENSVFKDYGIEKDKDVYGKTLNVANHIRAILDLMEQGNTMFLINFYNDFICTDIYDEEISNKVLLLKDKPNWNKIDELMLHEFKLKWIKFKKENNL